MPKAKEKSREPKDNGTSKDRPKRAARKPYRYRIDKHSTNSDSDDDSQQLHPDSDDESRHTLEARIRALESMITNRAKSLPSNQPETTMNTDLDPVPSTSQKSSNNRHKKRKSKHARDSRRKHESSTDEQVSSHDKKRPKKKSQKSHGTSTTDSSSDDEPRTNNPRGKRKRKSKKARKSHRHARRPISSESSASSSSSLSSSSSSNRECSDSSGSDSDSSDPNNDYRPIDSFGMLLGHNVSDKLKRKIIENKYVEFSRLIPEQSLTLDSGQGQVQEGKDRNLKLVKPKVKSIHNITQWSEAWETYLAVYTSVKQNRKHIQAMLTYARDVRTMAKLSYDWLAYDRQFRSDREKTKCSWATVRHDLHLIFRTPTPQHQNWQHIHAAVFEWRRQSQRMPFKKLFINKINL